MGNAGVSKNASEDVALPGEAGDWAKAAAKSVQDASQGLKKPVNADVSVQLRNATTSVLQFLASATNETLAACLVGLGAITYLVLGRVGLILMGLVGGIALHATWDAEALGRQADGRNVDELRRRREKGIDIVSRILGEREKTLEIRGDLSKPHQESISEHKELDYKGYPEETQQALNEFTDAVIRDHVKWWYSPLLPAEKSFPGACRQTLTKFLLSFSGQVARKRNADTFLDFVTNSSSLLIVFLSELSNALKSYPGLGVAEAIEEYILEDEESSLADILDKGQQERKLKGLAEDLLQNFLDLRAYACDPVRTFLREILAGLILEMTAVSCSKSDFINEWIIYALEDGETTELVQAIDAGVNNATGKAVEESKLAANGEIEAKQVETSRKHKRTVSRAEVAMQEAMDEARRLSEMIAADEAEKGEDLADDGCAVVDNEPMKTLATLRDGTSASELDSENSLNTPQADMHTNGSADETNTPRSAPTHFDQILSSIPTALRQDSDVTNPAATAPMTLYKAKISIFDDSVPGEKGAIKSRPTVEYLLQIEPASSQYPGWMIPRKYQDFEVLHEVVRRISVISGAKAFAEQYQSLPGWKSKTKTALRTDLEEYVQSALSFQALAESEAMKRFLEKDTGLSKSPSPNKGGLNFESVGKGMLDVLSIAPKGAASGGKALVGGVTGVFGGMGGSGLKRQTSTRQNDADASPGQLERQNMSTPRSLTRTDSKDSRQSIEGKPPLPKRSSDTFDSSTAPPLPTRPTQDSLHKSHGEPAESSTITKDVSSENGPEKESLKSDTDIDASKIVLPPPPSEIADDYSTVMSSPVTSFEDNRSMRTSTSTNLSSILPSSSSSISASHLPSKPQPGSSPAPTSASSSTKPALTQAETTVAIELFFATITELYSLSSAWTLRLTLLSAAKSYLLRPSNPNLEAIRTLLQTTVIDPYTSDSGVATLIRKVRANALPTEDELRTDWPPPPGTDPASVAKENERKEGRRVKARKLLVERGMPTALTGVMGQAASGEALGKVFDCLQVERVSKGLVTALMLQAVKALTQ